MMINPKIHAQPHSLAELEWRTYCTSANNERFPGGFPIFIARNPIYLRALPSAGSLR